MFRSFNRHSFRLSSWTRACLATFYVLLVSTGVLADIVLDTGPFEGEVTLTNLTFVSLEAYEQYKQGILNEISALEGDWVLMYGQIGLVDDNLRVADGHLHTASAKFQIWRHTQSSITTGYPYAEEGITAMNLAWSEVNSARSRVTTLEGDALTVSNQIATTRSLVQSDAYRTSGTFATSAGDDSSGGCQCPDYTQILNYIDSKLGDIKTLVNSINNNVVGIWTQVGSLEQAIDEWFDIWDRSYYYPIAEAAMAINSAYNHSSSEDTWGPTLGAILGGVFKTNQVASTLYYALTGQIEDQLSKSIWTSSLSSSGSSIADAIADALNPIRRMFSWNSTDYSSGYSPAERQILNFLWTRNVHPTNTISNPLFVTNTAPMTFEITPDSAGSSEHPINVSVGNPEVVIDANGVMVTNKIALKVSLDTYTGENGDALNVNVLNFEDLREIFDDYFRTGSGQQEAEDDKEEENDESEEELDDDLNADGKTPQFFLNFNTFHDAVTKYRQMLNSIRLLIPDQTSPPRFYFDYSFSFSSPDSEGSTPESSIQVTPIGPDTDQAVVMGRYLTVVRGFCSVIWLGVVLATGLWLIKWSIYGVAFATAISMTIASGDLASLARLLPGFLRNLLSAGDV